MKLQPVIFVALALLLCSMAISIAAMSTTTPQFTRDNIDDVLLILGTTAEEIPDMDAFLFELNERSAAAQNYGIFTSTESNVEVAELRKSAYYASIARCLNWGPKSVENWSCINCKNTPKVTDVFTGAGVPSDLAWFIGYAAEDNEIVITARSSATIENWLYDLDFKGIDFAGCNGCKMHSGFYKAYQEVRNDYLNAVYSLHTKYPTAKLRVQGHSLAAATSQHTVLDIATGSFAKIEVDGKIYWHNVDAEGYNKLSHDEFNTLRATEGTIVHVDAVKFELTLPFYNFGSPRVGNPEWAHFFQGVIGNLGMVRSVHLNDPVPRLPPRDLIWKYQHASNEAYWYSDSKFKTCNDSNDEDKKCSLGNILPFIITDHLWYNGIMLVCVPN